MWLPSLLGRHRSTGPSHGPQAGVNRSYPCMSCQNGPASRVRGHFTFPQEDWHQAHSGRYNATVSCELEVDEMVVSDGVRWCQTFDISGFFPIALPNSPKVNPFFVTPQVSEDAKQLIRKLLEMKPADRFTAEQAQPSCFCVRSGRRGCLCAMEEVSIGSFKPLQK